MAKKFFSLLLIFLLISGSVFAAMPESWLNSSITYDWSYNSEKPLNSGTADALGYNFSWFAFPGSA
ncbi:MAG: hypothetical protein PHR69_09585, partial [Sphaerochaeta sp.]|nr:hypothetical protein [Sphaerochaeta sp.]